MCDTLCALPPWSKEGAVLFAKNSDRSPNEPHLVIQSAAAEHAQGSTVKLTYLTIPQAAFTLETVLCKPSWTWGAEMGVNSALVAIGNEAVFTLSKRGSEALTGMDCVRLALERADSAAKAVQVITELLEKHGQGGNCGFDHPFHYDNSFLIADPREGYVLETSGKRWAAVKLAKSGAISNRLCIHKEHILRGGVEEGFDFAQKLSEPLYTHFSGSKQRHQSASSALSQPVDSANLMAALRKHAPVDEERVFTRGSVRSVCMHAGGLIGDHTTGSLVAVLREHKPATLWVTGASTPCIAAFKPVFFGILSGAPVFREPSDALAYWCERETLHRALLAGKVDVVALREHRDALESGWIAQEHSLFAGSNIDAQALMDFAAEAAAQEQAMVKAFTPKYECAMPSHGRFNRYWEKKNAVLGK